MAAKRTRQEARERLLKLFETELDRLVPADSAKPMKGKTFRDFSDAGRGLQAGIRSGVA